MSKPYEFGGLGVKDLRLQGLVLRVSWEWLRRTDNTRPWQGLPALKDDRAREVFDSLVKIQLGRGDIIRFWTDRWIDGKSVNDIAPAILQLVPVRTRKRRTVQEALVDNRWTLDMVGELPLEGFVQCVELCAAILQVERNIEEEDLFT